MDHITDPAVIEGYLVDASNTRGHAEVLVRPRSTDEVAAVLRDCQATGTPVTVTARRSSTTGGPVPQGGWLLSTELLDGWGDLDAEHPEVQGGALVGAFQDALGARGRHFPPDPTSRYESTIGAAVANNASGARSFRYGPTRPWIVAAEVVLPTGDVVWADRTTPVPEGWGWSSRAWSEPHVKTAAGFFPADNLLDVLIGHEGTLGVVTRVAVRTVQAPAAIAAILAFFPDRPSLLAMVARARRGAARPGRDAEAGSLNPRAIEHYDRHALAFARAAVPDIPAEAESALYFEVELAAGEELDLAAWWEALTTCGALADATLVTEDPRAREAMLRARHAVPAGINERVVAHGMPKVGTDFAVPDDALAEMMDAYEAVPLPHVLFGHIGDNHLHLNLLPRSPDELAQARALYRELALLAVSRGGTVSAEHGIGKIKRALLADMVGPDVLARFRALKAAVDPAWILGRGTMLDGPSAWRTG